MKNMKTVRNRVRKEIAKLDIELKELRREYDELRNNPHREVELQIRISERVRAQATLSDFLIELCDLNENEGGLK